MNNLFQALNRLSPDLMGRVEERITILNQIYLFGPIGRKALSERLNISERSLRTETDNLKKDGLIVASQQGMSTTSDGEEVLAAIKKFINLKYQFTERESNLVNKYHIRYVDICPGDSAINPKVYQDLADSVSELLEVELDLGDQVMAVTGGETLSQVTKYISSFLSRERNFMVVPARGGVGRNAAIQSNTIAEMMANHLKGTSMALYTPESMSESTINQLSQEPAIQQVIEKLSEANVLLFSIGDVNIMSKRRNLSLEARRILAESNAIGEVLGNYFNDKGEIVYRIPRIGLQFEDLEHIPNIIAVVGSSQKAAALQAFLKIAPNHLMLIADEGATKLVLNG